jgi:hypothetical protein
MITVSVSDGSFVSAALQLVVKQIDTDEGLDLLLAQGCSAELLDDLRNRKARDLVDVAPRIRSMQIFFSQQEIEGELHRLDRLREDQKLFEYFVRNGASRQTLCDLWKRTHEEVASMRRALLGGNASAGRTPLPRDHAVREAIHLAWDEITKTDPAGSKRQRLHALHQRFLDLSIDTLVATLDEFDQPDRPRVRRAASPRGIDRQRADAGTGPFRFA